jgi:hypothetical protein
MTAKEAQRLRVSIVFIGQFADHLPSCARYVPQIAEYCTCGYKDAYAVYQEALNLLQKYQGE